MVSCETLFGQRGPVAGQGQRAIGFSPSAVMQSLLDLQQKHQDDMATMLREVRTSAAETSRVNDRLTTLLEKREDSEQHFRQMLMDQHKNETDDLKKQLAEALAEKKKAEEAKAEAVMQADREARREAMERADKDKHMMLDFLKEKK